MTTFNPIRQLPSSPGYTSKDTLVVFGEVFERGYVNGLIDEAKAIGMKVIYGTVGRRDENQNLRPLTQEELANKNQSILINIPLEAGFDMDKCSKGLRPIDHLKDYGLTGWEDARLDWTSIQESRDAGTKRFRNNVKLFLKEVEQHLNPGANLIFAHTMAGGFPRARVVMPIANRVFKGTGARFSSSQIFWESEIGQLCEKSFNDVTGETLQHLIELSTDLRNKVESKGGQVSYCAYGYHGNEVLIDDKYTWYSYSPYLQGFAKLRLEDICQQWFKKKVKCSTYNVPEILTNSSSIFLGVEVVLYPLIRALKKEGSDSRRVRSILDQCTQLLKETKSLSDIDQTTQDYLQNPDVQSWPNLKGWPQHNNPKQMELMQTSSAALIEMHKSNKDLMTAPLSEVIFRACGKVIFHSIWNPQFPVQWIGHDLVAKVTSMD